jgi:alginate O-acetyltransferase complex protein AlgI
MSFVSPEFILFSVIVCALYFAIPYRFRWLLLLIASYIFYAYWNAWYILLIVFSTMVDYVVAREIHKTAIPRKRKMLLLVSMAVNLGVLFAFKYFNFFNDSAAELLQSLGIAYNAATLNVLLPVGISFYTFQSMSYTIDVYRRDIEPERNPGIFATYVAFFPQLVAGPIERAGNIIPQFHKQHDFNYDRIVNGLRRILWGMFKKVVIADHLAIYVNAVYNDVHGYSGLVLMIATIFFAFQIYCDFSAYSVSAQ